MSDLALNHGPVSGDILGGYCYTAADGSERQAYLRPDSKNPPGKFFDCLTGEEIPASVSDGFVAAADGQVGDISYTFSGTGVGNYSANTVGATSNAGGTGTWVFDRPVTVTLRQTRPESNYFTAVTSVFSVWHVSAGHTPDRTEVETDGDDWLYTPGADVDLLASLAQNTNPKIVSSSGAGSATNTQDWGQLVSENATTLRLDLLAFEAYQVVISADTVRKCAGTEMRISADCKRELARLIRGPQKACYRQSIPGTDYLFDGPVVTESNGDMAQASGAVAPVSAPVVLTNSQSVPVRLEGFRVRYGANGYTGNGAATIQGAAYDEVSRDGTGIYQTVSFEPISASAVFQPGDTFNAGGGSNLGATIGPFQGPVITSSTAQTLLTAGNRSRMEVDYVLGVLEPDTINLLEIWTNPDGTKSGVNTETGAELTAAEIADVEANAELIDCTDPQYAKLCDIDSKLATLQTDVEAVMIAAGEDIANGEAGFTPAWPATVWTFTVANDGSDPVVVNTDSGPVTLHAGGSRTWGTGHRKISTAGITIDTGANSNADVIWERAE